MISCLPRLDKEGEAYDDMSVLPFLIYSPVSFLPFLAQIKKQEGTHSNIAYCS